MLFEKMRMKKIVKKVLWKAFGIVMVFGMIWLLNLWIAERGVINWKLWVMSGTMACFVLAFMLIYRILNNTKTLPFLIEDGGGFALEKIVKKRQPRIRIEREIWEGRKLKSKERCVIW